MMSLELNESHVGRGSGSMDHYSPESVVTMLLLIVTFLLGVPGNGLVMWVTGVKMTRTVNTVWFWNLAVADMTCCLSLPFSIAHEVLHGHWPYGSFLCKVLPSIIVLNMFASVFTLVAISVDRCVLVVKPVWAQNHRNTRSAGLVCLGIWLLAFLMCVPVFLYRETFIYETETHCSYNYKKADDYQYNSANADYDESLNYSYDVYESATELNMTQYSPNSDGMDFGAATQAPALSTVITVTRSVLGFFLPLLVISACYMRLAWKVRGTRFAKVGSKTRKVLPGIVLAFCVSWAPYHIIGLAMVYLDSTALRRLDHLSQGLAYTNSCVNPVLYVFMGKAFKAKMRQSMQKLLESAFSEDVTQSTCPSKSRDSGHGNTVV
ncbi:C3a anaphylatoxin chemotactic receptor [Ascaphus truei]|uniref:C3a anaphylatoxin chemotactic receptor n=1 Tax=Ascaphus truei TaxID=8439 RepID=UPI003F5A0060